MLLQATGISKSFGDIPVVTNISVQVEDRERIGLVGVNGAGKSTLLKILAGEMSYDDGTIYKSKELKIGYLAQNSGLDSDKTLWDELMSVFSELLIVEKELRELEKQMADPALAENEERYEQTMHRYANRSEWFRQQGGYDIETKVRSILYGMGFSTMPVDTQVSTLSGGQKTRLALAKLLLEEPDLLMLDEPTNHLDIDTLSWLESYLRAYSGAILVVSHDRYFLDALVGTIVEIERHEARRYTGNYSKYIETKAKEYETQLKHYTKQEKEIARMEDFVRRNMARASTSKRAQSRQKMLNKVDRLERPAGDLKRASFRFEVERVTGKDVLTAEDLSFSYQDAAHPLFKQVSLRLWRGEMVALIGPNGIGKSSLLKLLIDEQKPLSGSFRWGSNVRMGYYDQEQGNLNRENTVLEEIWSEYPHLDEVKIRTVLGNFLFSGDDVLKKVAALSGGEKARVALAKLMLLNANVLILDEPTNHLDLYSREVLESALMDYEGTLLFISHDRYFLNKMAERVLEMSDHSITEYLGNYDDYIEKLRELEEIEAERIAALEQKGEGNRSSGGPGRASSHPASMREQDWDHAEGIELFGRTSGGAESSVRKMPAQSNAVKAADPASRSGASGEIGSDTANAANFGAKSFEEERRAKQAERQRQRRLEQLEGEIAMLEEEVTVLQAELADPKVYQDYVLVQEKQEHIDSKQAELTACYEEWETLIS